jgi:predicted DNA binding CopG/RHH family protein
MTPAEQDKQATKRRPKSRIPHFKTIEEEAEFWDTHSTTEFEDEFEPMEEDIRFIVTREGPKKAITVRLPEETVTALTKEAHQMGIGPSTLIRMWILEHLRRSAER